MLGDAWGCLGMLGDAWGCLGLIGSKLGFIETICSYSQIGLHYRRFYQNPLIMKFMYFLFVAAFAMFLSVTLTTSSLNAKGTGGSSCQWKVTSKKCDNGQTSRTICKVVRSGASLCTSLGCDGSSSVPTCK
jgi:hypothetical protein